MYKDRLYGFCYKLLCSEELSEEVVQETFVRLWERRSAIDPEKSLKAYLYTTAKNLIKDHQARYARQYEANHEIMWLSDVCDNNTQNTINYNEIQKVEEEVINQLPPQQREVYKLSRQENLPHQKIAESLGISINSVKTHLRLALKALRSRLADVSDILLFVIFMLSQN